MAKHDLLQLLWVYQDIKATQLKNIPLIDLIIYLIKPPDKSKIYNAKHKKLLQGREWLLKHIIEEWMDIKIYERTVTASGCPSKWNANLIFILKPG